MNTRNSRATQARKQLDPLLPALDGIPDRPRRGWLRAIREGLGMSTRQLAARMGVSQATVAGFERGEAADTITLRSLRQAAAAMDCRLVYALVPQGSLEDAVRRQAEALADAHLARIQHSMRLEDQALAPKALADERRRLVDAFLAAGGATLWREA